MRFGIVGTNFVSDSFVAGSKEVKEVELTCVTSGHYENAIKFAEKYHISTVCASLDEMLESGLVDAIYLAVPNGMHYEFTKKCIENGMPVLTEKPFMASSWQVKEIYELAKEKDVYVHDGIMPLYSKGFEVLKQSLPMVGKIHNVIIDFSKYSSRYDAYLEGKNPTTFRSELCNGAIMDLGVYCIADAVGLFGEPKQILSSAELLDTGADVSSNAIFVYDDFSAVIMNSKASDTSVPCVIEGEKGNLLFQGASLLNKIMFVDRKTKEETILFDQVANPFIAEIQDFVDSFSQGKKESSKVPHALSMAIIECIDTIRKQSGIVYPCDQ